MLNRFAKFGDIEIADVVLRGGFAECLHKMLNVPFLRADVGFIGGARFIEDFLGIVTGWHDTVFKRAQEIDVDVVEPRDSCLEGVNAGFKPFKKQNTHEAPQVSTGTLQILIRRNMLSLRLHIVPEAVSGISQLPDSIRFTEVITNLCIEALIGIFNAVFNRLERALWEKLLSIADADIGTAFVAQVIGELRCFYRFIRLGIVAVPPQDVVPRATDENVL